MGQSRSGGEASVGACVCHTPRRGAATRERFISAAAAIMAERGSSDFQMSEVSDRCHMSKGSLYYYFEDHAALVRGVIDFEMADLVRSIADICAKAPCARESLGAVACLLAAALRPGRSLSLALSSSRKHALEGLLRGEGSLAEAVALIERELERGKAEGLVRKDADCHLGVAALVGALLASGPESDPEKALSLVLDGMGPAPSLATNVGKDDAYVVA